MLHNSHYRSDFTDGLRDQVLKSEDEAYTSLRLREGESKWTKQNNWMVRRTELKETENKWN